MTIREEPAPGSRSRGRARCAISAAHHDDRATDWADSWETFEQDAAAWEARLRGGELTAEESSETNVWLRSLIARVDIQKARAQGIRFDANHVRLRWR